MRGQPVFFIILHAFVSCSLHAQNYIEYYNQANEAEQLFAEGNLISAQVAFSKLEKQFPTLKPRENFYIGIILCFNSDTSGYSYLLRSAKAGFSADEYVHNFQVRYPTLFISKLLTDQLAVIQRQLKGQQNKKVNDTLIYFFNKDTLFKNVQAPDTLRSKQLHASFLHYLVENGIPDPLFYGDAVTFKLSSEVASDPGDSLLYISYKEFFYQELVKGNLAPYYYGDFVDMFMLQYGKTMYGSYHLTGDKEISRDDVIQNRKKIGLSPYYDGPGQLTVRYPRF